MDLEKQIDFRSGTSLQRAKGPTGMQATGGTTTQQVNGVGKTPGVVIRRRGRRIWGGAAWIRPFPVSSTHDTSFSCTSMAGMTCRRDRREMGEG